MPDQSGEVNNKLIAWLLDTLKWGGEVVLMQQDPARRVRNPDAAPASVRLQLTYRGQEPGEVRVTVRVNGPDPLRASVVCASVSKAFELVDTLLGGWDWPSWVEWRRPGESEDEWVRYRRDLRNQRHNKPSDKNQPKPNKGK